MKGLTKTQVMRMRGWGGDAGKDGVSTIGPTGPPGRDGVNGTNGTNGAKGDKGDKGDSGINGTNGTDGIILRIDRYTLTTNASGTASVTYPTPYSVVPHVVLELTVPANNRQKVRLTSTTTTGFSILVEQQNQAALAILGVDILTAGVTVINGAVVKAVVTQA